MATRKLPNYLPDDWPEDVAIPTPEQWAQALREDASFARLVESWEHEEPQPMSTPESIARGDEYMRQVKAALAAGLDAPTPSIVDELLGTRGTGEFIEPQAPPDSFTDYQNSR